MVDVVCFVVLMVLLIVVDFVVFSLLLDEVLVLFVVECVVWLLCVENLCWCDELVCMLVDYDCLVGDDGVFVVLLCLVGCDEVLV